MCIASESACLGDSIVACDIRGMTDDGLNGRSGTIRGMPPANRGWYFRAIRAEMVE